MWSVTTGELLSGPMRVSDARAAAFNPANTLLAIASENVRLWDVAVRVGEPIAGSVVNGYATGLVFSPDGSRLAVARPQPGTKFYPGEVALVDVLPSLNVDASVLADLGEEIAAVTLNSASVVVPITPGGAHLARLKASADPFVRWFFSDPWTRTTTPVSTIGSPDYISALLEEGDYPLAEAKIGIRRSATS
jgi:hypothetical protein